jgi:hypothetical protein
MKTCRFVAASCLVWLMCLVAAHAQQGQTATVAASAPVMLMPDPSRTPLATLRPGTQVKVLTAEEQGWYQVSFRDGYLGDRVGYVRSEHLRLAAAPAGPEKPAVAVAAASAPVKAVAPAPTNSVPAAAAPVTASPSPDPTPAPSPSPETARSRRSFPGLSEQIIEDAISYGHRQKGRGQGLRLTDSGQTWAALMTAGGTGPTASNGFRLQVHTPIAWIRQLASDAAKEYRRFSADEVTEEMATSVLRVTAYPDTPNTVTSGGMAGTSSVRHVVLRSESRDFVVQPLSREAFTEDVSNAMGGRATFEGLRLTFPMDAVRELRGPRGDREFFITVIGSTGEEKNFKVKKKHFDDLPM